MSNKPPRCGVCESLTKNFLCVSCLSLVHQEQRSQLLQLRRKKDELLGKLTRIFEDRAERQEKKHKRDQLLDSIQKSRAAAQAATTQLLRARADAGILGHANRLRSAKLERLVAQVQGNKAELLDSYFPHLIRYQSLTFQHVSFMLLHEQKLKLKQVQDILPLKVEGMGGGTTPGEGSAILSICGVRVPDHMSNLLDGRHTPEATSAALGYTLLLLDLLGAYLGGPLLHEGSFQASTTVLWQQQSFWNRRPGSSASVLPLYTEDIPQGGSLVPAHATKSSSSWSLGGLMRGGPAVDKAGAGSAPGPGHMEELRKDSSEERSALQGSKYAELQAAHDMLQRSISCFVRDLIALAPGVQLPPSWSPVAWLVMLCAQYHRDPRIEGLVQAAKSMAGQSQGPSAAAVLSPSPGLPASIGSAESELLVYTAAARQQEDGEEDWDVLLPPKPSESDSELELWTRAMMPQRSSSQQLSQTSQRILTPLVAAAAAARNAFGKPGGGGMNGGGMHGSGSFSNGSYDRSQ